ncbi:TRAP transporter permease [Marasmitruncus massiliensis]|uniref:TRAP transporter permease n=1 Tax=Marasmitruncus massiliensis TaxID=1944642 RepID=UPI000C7CEAEC|nr:TRAP transporter permease [Marasmitruncus massiliensis]
MEMTKQTLECKPRLSLSELSKYVIFFIGLAAAIFHIYVSSTGVLEAYKMRTLHMMFMLPMAFLMFPMSKKGYFAKQTWLDFLWFFATLFSLIYLSQIAYGRLIMRIPFVTPFYYIDFIVSVFLVVAVLEATRRAVGWGMVIICIAALAYAFLGNRIQGDFGYTGTTLLRMAEQMCLSTGGIFGSTVAASATFIFMFMLFGEFLQFSGAGQFFIDIAFALTGKARGGPAKMAVVASCLMGTVSGSSTANVTSTGTYTIPLMKKVGYRPVFAGAVEASASTGGQILPPVMGAASFLLAEYVGISYITLCAAAAVPAILYFVAVFCAVHFEAVRTNLKGAENENGLPWTKILLTQGYLALPLAVIIVTMVLGVPAYRAALYSIVSCVILVLINSILTGRRVSVREFVVCLAKGAKGGVMIAVTCAAAGIIIGVSSETGIGIKFASAIIRLAHGNLFLILPMVMLASLVLGMGLPTSAAYIMVASIAVPALTQMGINVLAAHLFALYFGVFSGITPPVAISAFAAAGLAGSKPMQTGGLAMWISLPAFIIPYALIFNNALILQGTLLEIFGIILITLVGVWGIAAGAIGCMFIPLRGISRTIILACSIVMVVTPQMMITLVCCAAVIAISVLNLWQAHHNKNEMQTEESPA